MGGFAVDGEERKSGKSSGIEEERAGREAWPRHRVRFQTAPESRPSLYSSDTPEKELRGTEKI
jgi:hypothetical protein